MSNSPSRGPLSGALETSHSMERPPKRSKSSVTSQPELQRAADWCTAGRGGPGGGAGAGADAGGGGGGGGRAASDEVVAVVERGVRVAVCAQLALEVEAASLELEARGARSVRSPRRFKG
ncbi:hypothetical protein RR46_07498 [Papilio xuthus]|uniref:Uncharacterized protein n=1 Tax=Papilio xuthus TaxID=66420 RepID=A0A194Q5M9_PAPXU|nr:hypothetical protein RR46_07498 [Papilio xuthus]